MQMKSLRYFTCIRKQSAFSTVSISILEQERQQNNRYLHGKHSDTKKINKQIYKILHFQAFTNPYPKTLNPYWSNLQIQNDRQNIF